MIQDELSKCWVYLVSADRKTMRSGRLYNRPTTTGIRSVERIGFLYMRLKTILATLLAVLLLTGSSMASACAVSCDLEAFGSHCHASSTKTSVAAQGMTDCGMVMGKNPAVSRADSNACTHVCEQQPQAARNDHGIAALRGVSLQQALVLAVLVYPPAREGSLLRHPETPPLRSPLLVALQSNLRI